MKVLLLKDVYKLGRAGDVKRVADGYGRNYLLPQGMAVLATPEALKMSERIREKANVQRAIVNEEMDTVAKQIVGLTLAFPAKASETGKLYGSVTTQMIADAIKAKAGVEIARRQIDSQPLRMLGEYKVHIRLTVDLIPTIDVIVYREGEAFTPSTTPVTTPATAPATTGKPAPVVEELEAEEEPAAEPEDE
ncbi:MAG: 50S ribosomal protein L9 [Anaerolineales bacterium]|nr:50S ribosomal protein L9 [Anaerolineae bacterium]PWB56627.1 MAG: 50S ribosomal protein L9 [Anaerolineales bacterium]